MPSHIHKNLAGGGGGSGPKGVVFDLLSVCVLWPEIGNRLDPYVWV